MECDKCNNKTLSDAKFCDKCGNKVQEKNYCHNCGNKLSSKNKFCGKCGVSADNSINKTHSQSTQKEKVSGSSVEKKSPWGKIAGSIASISGIVIGFLAVKYFGFIAFAILAGAVWVGWWFPGWYMKRDKIRNRLINVVVWSNIVTWIIPVIGYATATAAIRFSTYIPTKKRKFQIIGVIGVIASIASSVVGVLLVS